MQTDDDPRCVLRGPEHLASVAFALTDGADFVQARLRVVTLTLAASTYDVSQTAAAYCAPNAIAVAVPSSPSPVECVLPPPCVAALLLL